MKVMLFLFLFFLGEVNASPRKVHPLSASALRYKSYQYDISTRYSKTLSYFDVDSNEVALNESFNYSLMDFDLGISYGFRENFTVGLDGKFRQVTSENSLETLTTSGIESIGVSFKYQLKKNSNYRYAFVGKYRYKAYENTVYSPNVTPETGELVLGDSGSEFELDMLMSYVFTKWTTIEAEMGYRLPANDLSPEIPYSFSYVKNYNAWSFWLGVKGVYSLGLDNYSDNPLDKPQNATGSTLRWNSVNRSFMMPLAGIKFLLKKKYRLSLEGGQVYAGSFVDKSFDFIGKLSWNFGGKSSEKKFEERFKEYISEATVVKVSPRAKFLKIDKGMAHDISKGSRVDIYKSDYFGGNLLLASGVVYEIGPDWAIVKLTKKYRKMPIVKGLTARLK